MHSFLTSRTPKREAQRRQFFFCIPGSGCVEQTVPGSLQHQNDINSVLLQERLFAGRRIVERMVSSDVQTELPHALIQKSIDRHPHSAQAPLWLISFTNTKTHHDRNLISALLLKTSPFFAFSHCLRLEEKYHT